MTPRHHRAHHDHEMTGIGSESRASEESGRESRSEGVGEGSCELKMWIGITVGQGRAKSWIE